MFIDTQFDAAAFLLVTFMVGEFLLGPAVMNMFDETYYRWHKEYRKLIWLPGRRFVPLLWVALAIAVDASLYTFLKHLYPVFPVDTYVAPTVIVLAVVNLWLHRLWSNMLVQQRNAPMAMAAAALLLGTAVGIMVVYGLQSKYVELGTFAPWALWCALALWFSWQVKRADSYKHYTSLQQGEPQVYEMSQLSTHSGGAVAEEDVSTTTMASSTIR